MTTKKQIWEAAMSPRRKGEAPRFVILEPDAFLSDAEFQAFTAAERGTYTTLIFYLYKNNGRLPMDEAMLMGLLKCTKDELHTVLRKFQIRDGMCTHKRVQKELNKAQKRMNAASQAAKARWDKELGFTEGHADALPTQCGRNAKRSEAKRSEVKKDFVSNTSDPAGPLVRGDAMPLKGLLPSATARLAQAHEAAPSTSSLRVHSVSPRFAFYDKLTEIVRPTGKSDRTSLRNLTKWLDQQVQSGRCDEHIFDRVLDHARDARGGNNPRAVFFALLRDDIGYNAKAEKEKRRANGA